MEKQSNEYRSRLHEIESDLASLSIAKRNIVQEITKEEEERFARDLREIDGELRIMTPKQRSARAKLPSLFPPKQGEGTWSCVL